MSAKRYNRSFRKVIYLLYRHSRQRKNRSKAQAPRTTREAALKRSGCVGIRMRGVEKSELFEYVVKCGALPKKTFSLGEAEEKRFYLEARKIK